MVEGFHRGFKTRVPRPSPSVQEYFRAIRAEQTNTDWHLNRLERGITPCKKRKSSQELYDTCLNFSNFEILDYMFEVAKYFGNDVE